MAPIMLQAGFEFSLPSLWLATTSKQKWLVCLDIEPIAGGKWIHVFSWALDMKWMKVNQAGTERNILNSFSMPIAIGLSMPPTLLQVYTNERFSEKMNS